MRVFPALATLCFMACSTGSSFDGFLERQLVAVQELRIGSVDDPEYALTWFRDLDIGPDGNIYTLHPQEHAIRVHDSSGVFLRVIGREGEGPGEFSSPGPMGLLGDTLWVLDRGTYRFSFFDGSGEFLRSQRMPIDLGSGRDNMPPRPRGLLSDGSIRGGSPVPSSMVAAGEITTTSVLRLDSTGSVLDTLATYSVENGTWQVTDPDDPRSMRSYQTQPFSDTEIVSVSSYAPLVVRVERPAGSSADETVFSVTATSFGGDTIFSHQYEYTPIALDGALVDSLVEARAASVADSPFPSAPTADRAAVWARTSLYRPDFHPPVSAMRIGQDGSIWLCSERTGTPTVTWRILAPDGQAIGVVDLPVRFTPLTVESDRAWGVFYDELDVPYIMHYRLMVDGDVPQQIPLGDQTGG